MPSTARSIQWIDHTSRLDGLPGEFRRHGRYLYLLADRSDGVVADGHPVDGLQLVRTTPHSPTRLEIRGVVLEGVQDNGEVGVRIIEDLRPVPTQPEPVADLSLS
jgi:hypothetical protein